MVLSEEFLRHAADCQRMAKFAHDRESKSVWSGMAERWFRCAEVAKKHGVSEQTIYTWRKRFGMFQANDVRRLKQLEAENARLKKLVAERDLEIEVMKEITGKNW